MKRSSGPMGIGDQLKELHKLRTELGLNTRDMLVRLKSHCHLENLTERIAQLKIQPCPQDHALHQSFKNKVEALMLARKKTENRSMLDLTSTLC